MTIPANPDLLLTRRDAAAALTEAGYPTRPATLATKASRGGGPPFRKYGRRVLYRWADCLGWAEAMCSPVIGSTSELDTLTSAS
jgi:hypothetical protein